MFSNLAPIAKSLLGGWSAKTVVKQLSKQFPKIAPYVQKAEAAGYLAPSILRTLIGDDRGGINTEHAKRRTKEKNRDRKQILALLATVGGVGIGAAKLAGRGAISAAAQAAAGGATPPPGGSPIGPAAQAVAGAAPPVGGQPGMPAPQPGPTGPTPPNSPRQSPLRPITPEEEERRKFFGQAMNLPESQSPPSKVEQQFPHLPAFIQRLDKEGHSPEEIYEVLKRSSLVSPIINKVETESGEPYLNQVRNLVNTIKQQESSTQANATPTPEAPVIPVQPKASTPVPLEAPKTQPVEQPLTIQKASKAPIEKNEIRITPFGAGEVQKVHKDDAYIAVNGKLKKVPLSETEAPEPDVIAAVSNILKIPEIDRSSNVALFVYDPSENKALFQFHDGSVYKYLDISPQVVQDIANKNATPITSGQNEYGAWSPDDPHGSIGAALWAHLLKDPKYAKPRKGEPENPNYKKLENLYDYWTGLRKKKKNRK